jgi:hypothetical protein
MFMENSYSATLAFFVSFVATPPLKIPITTLDGTRKDSTKIDLHRELHISFIIPYDLLTYPLPYLSVGKL